MEPLIVMLFIPGVALMMYFVNSARRQGLDRESRDLARRGLGLLGGILLLLAAGFVFWILLELSRREWGSELVLWTILRCVLVGFLCYAGRSAIRVSRHAERHDLTLAEHSQRERESEGLTLGILVLACVPLLVPGTLLLMVLAGFVGIEFTLFALAERARENRLLWTLALAGRHGLSFADELEALALSERPKHRARLLSLVNALRDGTPLGQALLSGPRLLPAEIAAGVRAAEEQGDLRHTLPDMAIHHTRRLRSFYWDSTLNNITIYVWAITIAVAGITSFIIYFIIPKYKAVFNDFGLPLPSVTERFVEAGDFLASYWFLVLPVVCCPFLLLFSVAYLNLGANRWTPRLVRGLFPRLATPSLLRCLGHAAERQESLTTALQGLEESSGENSWQGRYGSIRNRIEGGEPLGEALRSEGILNAREAEALRHAEQVGHLPWALCALADRLERQRLNRFRWCVETLKPVAVFALGLCVLFFCVAMFLPIVKIINELS